MTQFETLLTALHDAREAAVTQQAVMYVGKVETEDAEDGNWIWIDPAHRSVLGPANEAADESEEETELQISAVLCVDPRGKVWITEL